MLDDGFAELFTKFIGMNEAENNFTAEEYIDFDNKISRFHPPINSETVDWKAVLKSVLIIRKQKTKNRA